jgi:hypothetical protein
MAIFGRRIPLSFSVMPSHRFLPFMLTLPVASVGKIQQNLLLDYHGIGLLLSKLKCEIPSFRFCQNPRVTCIFLLIHSNGVQFRIFGFLYNVLRNDFL